MVEGEFAMIFEQKYGRVHRPQPWHDQHNDPCDEWPMPLVNPILAIFDWFKAVAGVPIDEASFYRLAQGRRLYVGLILFSFDSVNDLAVKERINVAMWNGKITAFDEKEWIDKSD